MSQLIIIIFYAAVPPKPSFLCDPSIPGPHPKLPPRKPKLRRTASHPSPSDEADYDRTGDSGIYTGSGSASVEVWRSALTQPPPGK